MAKDWEWYRREFITYHMDYVYGVLKTIEDCSPIERIAILQCIQFRDSLGATDMRVVMQEEVGPYHADITVKQDSINFKVAIECDGHDFHEKTKEQAAKDKKRDREFQKLGYVILRYTGSEIVNTPEIIMRDLKNLHVSHNKVV